MKKIWSLFLAIVLMIVLTVPAWADNGHHGWNGHGPVSWGNQFGPGVFGPFGPFGFPGRGRHNRFINIGLASGIGPDGQADPHVTVVPPGGSSQQAVICSSTPTPPWAIPIGRSEWISLQADCTTGLAAGATYVYTVQFNLPNNFQNPSISGNVLADDSVNILLNNNNIFSGGGFTSASSFSSNNASFFNSGTNTLTFSVYNAGGPSGLDFLARVQATRQHGGNNQGDNTDNDNDNDGD